MYFVKETLIKEGNDLTPQKLFGFMFKRQGFPYVALILRVNQV